MASNLQFSTKAVRFSWIKEAAIPTVAPLLTLFTRVESGLFILYFNKKHQFYIFFPRHVPTTYLSSFQIFFFFWVFYLFLLLSLNFNFCLLKEEERRRVDSLNMKRNWEDIALKNRNLALILVTPWLCIWQRAEYLSLFISANSTINPSYHCVLIFFNHIVFDYLSV